MQAKHGQLTANTVATQNIGGDPVDGWSRGDRVEVCNRDGVAEIFFTVDGSTPSVGGDNTFLVPATVGALTVDANVDGPVPIKLISVGTPKYTVTVLP
jgi:hypothetical protein